MSDRHAQFQTTDWSLVTLLRSPSDEDRRRALELIAERSRPPVVAYLLRTGLRQQDADDIAQGFFADVVMGRRLLDQADRRIGRLRSLILTALKRYRIDALRRGARSPVNTSLERNPDAAPVSDERPDAVFDAEWAASLVAEAVRRCREHFCSHGREAHWRLFEMRELLPATNGLAKPALAEAAEACGFARPADAAAAVQTVKRRALAIFSEVIAETVADARDAEDERAALLGALGVAPSL